MVDRYGKSMGIWKVDIGGANLELKPILKDNKRFRDILLNEDIRKNKPKLFDEFESFLFDIIKRAYPGDDDNRIKEYISYNINALFEKTIVDFGWSTKEDIEKNKKEAINEIKNLLGSN